MPSLISVANSAINFSIFDVFATLKRACFMPVSAFSTPSIMAFCCALERPLKRLIVSLFSKSSWLFCGFCFCVAAGFSY